MYKELTKNVFEIELLGLDDAGLKQLASSRHLGMSADELRLVQNHFKKIGRNPTDIELEAFAQSWSEHCCYKSSKNILRETVFKVKSPASISAIAEDAAVMEFDERHAYVLALESHNHPSALDPYGGAATGVGGIIRDVVCMGAQPIALVDPIFFGPLDFPDENLPKGTKSPKYLLHGVVSGIGDYGNRVGIPTVGGMVFFDESYVGNCLVNVGCLGILPKSEVIGSRVGGPGDVLIYAGGKTGRDGIHGVTFASAELDEESEKESRPAVQLGYAIMKEPLIHACLEANRKRLLTGLKDFGGGGLSCVCAEMAHAGGCGAAVNLDKIPLKEEGLSPWEIWVSESQERMLLSAKPEDVDDILEIFKFWDVPAVVIGDVDNSGRITAEYDGVTILNLDLEFLLKGVCYDRPREPFEYSESEVEFKMFDLEQACAQIIGMQNIASREAVIRRYDHQVRGNTILTPMQGIVNYQTHGDACVLKPLADSDRGLALTCDVNPVLCRINPYWGSANAVDEVVRNLCAVGARPHSMADCLNFANPEKPRQLGILEASCRGLHYMTDVLKVPFVSGNVSLYNESILGPIAPTPTLFGVGMVGDVNKVVSTDLKKKGSRILLVGETTREMAGSAYYQLNNINSGIIPKPNPEVTKKLSENLVSIIEEGLIRSCHDISEGGLFVALSEMCFGGRLGVELDLSVMGGLRTDFKLFSESPTRWVVEVGEKNAGRVSKELDAIDLGRVIGNKSMYVKDGEVELHLVTTDLQKIWAGGVERE
ncbi:MAG TPA: phosphoribosylformylglycinamidine synthase subunit PurL [Candidatus Altiarchaeales archaeon]|nr:phosphoribosylformylglycinamidine synthase subunit PurL [Candidatus Altiarchaeales archaeon]